MVQENNMQSYIYRKGMVFFVKHNEQEIEIAQDEYLDVTDTNRRIDFQIVDGKAKILHRYPKEHNMFSWLTDSSEYPSDYYS